MSTIAKINGIAVANIAKIDGIAKANISKVDGISISIIIPCTNWVTPTAVQSCCGESEVNPVSNTIDDNLTTQWMHYVTHEHWVIFDMNTSKTITSIRLYTNKANYSPCEVSAIYINDTADEAGGSKGSGSISASGWTVIDVTDTMGRYIKLKLKTWNTGQTACGITNYLANLNEFDACIPWASPTAIHSQCLSSAPHYSTHTIDGDLDTFWGHAEQHEHWIIFDLGATKTVDKVRLYCNGTVAQSDLCEVSAIYINDTADEAGGSKGSGSISSGLGWKEIDVTDTSGRYIKLKLKTYTAAGACVITQGITNFYEFEYV